MQTITLPAHTLTRTHTYYTSLGYFSGILPPSYLSLLLASPICLKLHVTHFWAEIQLAHGRSVCYMWETEASWKRKRKKANQTQLCNLKILSTNTNTHSFTSSVIPSFPIYSVQMIPFALQSHELQVNQWWWRVGVGLWEAKPLDKREEVDSFLPLWCL